MLPLAHTLLCRYCVQVRRGNYRVQEHHHTVIMYWNKQLLPVLQQVGDGVGCALLRAQQLQHACIVHFARSCGRYHIIS